MLVLIISAISVGFIHTLLGPDHYVPFIVLAKSRGWNRIKTALITLLCGVGHVLSAAILGIIAISIGLGLNKLNFIESFRSEVAAWLLIGFGFAYFLWGLRNAIKNKKHSHLHFHIDGTMHFHNHGHIHEHSHVHSQSNLKELTPWVLFIIFILGPCEPLIPLIMYPAIQKSILSIVWVILSFSVATLFTMLSMVLITVYSTKRFAKLSLFGRYGNAAAGIVICSCGLAIRFLGV